jgi:ABC-type glycerol-3-phosphate transport system substrate-binding protein
MRMTKRRWLILTLGVVTFLAAFGIAFASQHHPTWQVWQTKDGTAT